MTYTLELALVDFLPIIFSAIGLYFVYRMVAHTGKAQGQMAKLAAPLIVAGGLFKAIWKTIMALTQGAVDIVWMFDSLFAWMMPGFILMAWAVWLAVQSVRGKSPKAHWWLPLIIIGLTYAVALYVAQSRPDQRTWNTVLLSVMVMGTVVTSVLLIVFAFRQKMPFMGLLFILNLIGVFALNGLARLENQTITLQWIEEGINAISWLVFAVAAWKIYGYTRSTFGVDPAEVQNPSLQSA